MQPTLRSAREDTVTVIEDRQQCEKKIGKRDKFFGGEKLPRDVWNGRVEVLLAQSCGNRFHPTEPCRPESHRSASSDLVVRVINPVQQQVAAQ